MIKHLALLSLLATPAFAQLPAEDAAPRPPSVPLVTFDITGTFPANAPTTKMTAPNAAFYLEFSVPQTIPANPSNEPENFGCPTYNVTFVFNGQVFHPAGNYSRADSGGNIENLSFATRFGGIGLYTVPAYHAPYLAGRRSSPNPSVSQPVAVFASGDLGAGDNWYFGFLPKGSNSPYFVRVPLTDVTGRVVLPQPRPLATR